MVIVCSVSLVRNTPERMIRHGMRSIVRRERFGSAVASRNLSVLKVSDFATVDPFTLSGSKPYEVKNFCKYFYALVVDYLLLI